MKIEPANNPALMNLPSPRNSIQEEIPTDKDSQNLYRQTLNQQPYLNKEKRKMFLEEIKVFIMFTQVGMKYTIPVCMFQTHHTISKHLRPV